MRWEAGFQGLRRGEKRSIQHVCEHFRPKHNAEITFPARLFSVRNGARLTYHRNLHLTRFCQKTKKASLIKGRFGGFVYIAGWRTRGNRLYLAYETARVSRITVIFT